MKTSMDYISNVTQKYLDKLMTDRFIEMMDSVSMADLYFWNIKFSMKYTRSTRKSKYAQLVFIIDEENKKKILKKKPNWNGRITTSI